MRARIHFSILTGLAVMTMACGEGGDADSMLAPQLMAGGGGSRAVELAVDVRYYFGAISQCANPAVQDAGGDWTFPAPLPEDAPSGSAACLIAQVSGPGNTGPSGFVLWEMCGVPGDIGPKADCDVTGTREWGPRTGEVWSPVDAAGEVVTASHSIACLGVGSLTRGYRYRYSLVDPTTHPAGEKIAVTFAAFDVTADGENCP